MAMISKEIFDRFVTSEVTCSIMHPHSKSCVMGSLYIFKEAFIGLNKFFIPIYMLQMLLYGKKLNKEGILKYLKAYKRTMAYGILFCMLFFISNCYMRRLLGRFHYSIIGLFCGFISGLPIYIESPENILMNTLIFSSLGTEAVIRNLDWFKVIRRTVLKETFLFMLSSGFLMYLLETQKVSVLNFWFFHPSKIVANKEQDSKKSCYHEKSQCIDFIFKESLKYFGFGYAVEMVKFTISNFNKLITSPNLILKMLTSKKNVLFGVTIGGYVAIYRLISCLLFKFDKRIEDYHSLIAGTISGITYLIKPNLQFLCLAIVTIIQMLIQRLRKHLPLSENLIGLLFALLNGFLMHNRFFYAKTCPNYTKNMVTVCSNGAADRIYENLLRIFPAEVLFSRGNK